MRLTSPRRLRCLDNAWPVLVLVLACLGGCAAPGVQQGSDSGPGSDAAPATAPAATAAPQAPKLTMPPEPSGRSEAALWDTAVRRGRALQPLVEADLRAVQPGPIPPEVLAQAAPAPAKPALVPARVSPPAPAATPVPAVSAPPPATRPTVGSTPEQAAMPDVRIVQKYTADNGLPSNRITAVFVDSEDAWVGTADAGLARLNFAEGNWIITQTIDGLAGNRVTDITSYKGMMFVGTQNGISIWDGTAWTTEAQVDKVNLVNTVFQVKDDVLWAAARAMNGGLVTFDGSKWKDRSTIKPGTLLNNISDFTFAGDDLWIGTTNRGVYRFGGKSWTTYTVADGIASNFVYTIEVRGTSAYLGGCCGVSALEGGEWRIYDIAEGLAHSTVNDIAVDGGLVWFGSKKGLSLYDGIEFQNFSTDQGLTDDRITAVFVSGQDVWVGTASGLNRLEKSY